MRTTMEAVFYTLLSVAMTAFLGSAVAFRSVTKREWYEIAGGNLFPGSLWVFVRRACEGWRRSALGRSLLIIGIGSGIAALMLRALAD